MRGSLMTTLALLRLASQLLGGSPASAQIVDVPRFSLDASFSHATAPAVAVGLDGTLLFLWSEALRNDRGAFTRPFSNSGTPLTPKHRVDTSGHVYETGLSAAVDGGFVGSWHRNIPNCDVATYGQRLSALGAPLGSSFRVSDGSLTDGAVAVASLPAGPVFLWEQIPELYFRLYDPKGLPRGGQVAVGSGWLHSDIAARPDGGFVTVWWGFEPGLNLARLYDGKGTPYGDAFLVSEEFLPTSVAVTTTGDFVVAGVGAGEGSEPGAVWYRRFTSAGTPAGSPVPVHLPAPGDTYEPDIAVDAQGNVYLAWGGYNLQSSMRLPPQARAYDPADRPLGPVFELDTWPSEGVHVARLPDGRFVNAWAALGSAFASVVSLCTPGVASCGDGVRHPQCEECDDGAANSDTVQDACRTDCRRPRCGDGVVDRAESCDDGNRQSCDGCSAQCASEPGIPCGDGIPNALCGQSCDDGNAIAGDGCDPGCTLERIPGGGAIASDCLVEWQVNNPANVPFLDKKGAINGEQVCVDDDPRCDFDGQTPGSCTFLVRVCANNTDIGACRPGTRLASWTLRKPSASQAASNPVAAAVRAAFLSSVPGAIVGSDAPDVCSGDVAVTVPLRASGGGPTAGKLKLASATALYDGRRDKDKLLLTCLPPPS